MVGINEDSIVSVIIVTKSIPGNLRKAKLD